VAAVSAGGVMTLASGVVAFGVVDGSIAASVGGGFTVLASATLLALAKIRVWTCDTKAERTRLASAQQDAEDQRTRYVAAQGALMEERSRILRDLENERAANSIQLEASKAALQEKYEAEREQLIVQSTETAISLYLRGMLAPPPQVTPAKILDLFPEQQPARARATAHPADPDPAPEATRDREAYRP